MHLDLDMGRYVLFVWGSYGLSALALAALTVLSLRARARARKVLEALQQATEPS